MTTDRFVMIDGHALAYRMFFALPLESFTTKSGEPTNATYGFTRTLLDLIPVSYTHLDVYKRQAHRFAGFGATRRRDAARRPLSPPPAWPR